METGNAVDTLDLLTDTAAKVCCLADLIGYSDAEQLFLSDQSLQGMCSLLNNIQNDIEKAGKLLSQALAPPPEAAA